MKPSLANKKESKDVSLLGGNSERRYMIHQRPFSYLDNHENNHQDGASFNPDS